MEPVCGGIVSDGSVSVRAAFGGTVSAGGTSTGEVSAGVVSSEKRLVATACIRAKVWGKEVGRMLAAVSMEMGQRSRKSTMSQRA